MNFFAISPVTEYFMQVRCLQYISPGVYLRLQLSCRNKVKDRLKPISEKHLDLSPGHSQILSCSHGEKSVKGLESYYATDQKWWTRFHNDGNVTYMIPGLLLIFLHSCKIKSGSGLEMRLKKHPRISKTLSEIQWFLTQWWV